MSPTCSIRFGLEIVGVDEQGMDEFGGVYACNTHGQAWTATQNEAGVTCTAEFMPGWGDRPADDPETRFAPQAGAR